MKLPTPDASYTADEGDCDATLTFAAEPTDNCGILSTVYSVDGTQIAFPYDFPVGTTTVNVLVTDVNTNTAECSFDVVVDPIPVCGDYTGTLFANTSLTRMKMN